MNLGIMGFGHIAQAFVKGLLNTDIVGSSDIYTTARSSKTRLLAEEIFKVNVCDSNTSLINTCDLIFICLPAKAFYQENVLSTLDLKCKIFISFMAGVKIDQIKEVLGDVDVIRAMPNLGMADNDGVTAYTKTSDQRIIDIFDSLGYAFLINEKEIEKVTALASCGVGFAAYILSCFDRIAKELGFDDKSKAKIVSNIFRSALKHDDHSSLADAVATKGGATETGIDSLKEAELYEILNKAVLSAYDKMNK